MKRWIAILVTAMLAILQTGAFAECDDEISNYTRYADYIPQAAEPVGLIPGENHRTLVVWFSRVGNTVFCSFQCDPEPRQRWRTGRQCPDDRRLDH